MKRNSLRLSLALVVAGIMMISVLAPAATASDEDSMEGDYQSDSVQNIPVSNPGYDAGQVTADVDFAAPSYMSQNQKKEIIKEVFDKEVSSYSSFKDIKINQENFKLHIREKLKTKEIKIYKFKLRKTTISSKMDTRDRDYDRNKDRRYDQNPVTKSFDVPTRHGRIPVEATFRPGADVSYDLEIAKRIIQEEVNKFESREQIGNRVTEIKSVVQSRLEITQITKISIKFSQISPTPGPTYRPTPAPTYPDDDYDDRTTVKIKNDAYNPQEIRIQKGETVTWINKDDEPHTVTSDDGDADSGNINPGGTFSSKFAEEGTYGYYCKIHPSMRGTVIVGAGETGGKQIQILKPSDGERLDGAGVFQALVPGMDLNNYKMYWQVDNGGLNEMWNGFEIDPPHKHYDVNFANWNWRADHRYQITFIAKNMQGNEIARKSINIFVYPAGDP